MPTKHYCDVCGDEMTDGYTVEWKDDIQSDGGLFVGRSIPDRTEKIVCKECWPGWGRWFEVIQRLVE